LRKRYSYKPYITYIGTSKAKNQANRYCLWIDYIFTFLVYLIEILQKRYKGLFIVEAMSPSGNKWIKKYKPKKVSSKRKKSNKFIIDETQIKFGSSQ